MKQSRIILSIAASVVFCVLFCWKIQALGMTVDEATHGVWASAVLDNLRAFLSGGSVQAFPYSDGFSFITVGRGFEFPLTIRYFTGTYPIYFLVPFVAAFGKNAFAVRIGFLLCALVFAFSFRYCVKKIWNSKVADLGFLFLILNPLFLRSYRLGIEREEALLLPLFWLGGAFLAGSGNNSRQSLKLFACGVCWGMGIWAKLMFVAFIAAGGGFVLCNLRVSFDFLRKIGLKSVSGSLAFFSGLCAGGAGLLWYNIREPFASVKGALDSLGSLNPEFGKAAADNSAFLDNAILRVNQFAAFAVNILNLDGIGPEWGMSALFFAVVSVFCIGLLIYGCVKGRLKNPRFVYGLFFAVAVYLLLSCFSPTRIEAGHMVGLLWFFPLIQALALVQLLQNRMLAKIITVAVAGLSLFMSVNMLKAAGANKATGLFFSGSYECRQYLKHNRTLPVVFCPSDYMGLNLTYGINELIFDKNTGTGKNNKENEENKDIDEMYFLFERGGSFGDNQAGRNVMELLKKDTALDVTRVKIFSNRSDDYRWELYLAKRVKKRATGALTQALLVPGSLSGVSSARRPLRELCGFLGVKKD